MANRREQMEISHQMNILNEKIKKMSIRSKVDHVIKTKIIPNRLKTDGDENRITKSYKNLDQIQLFKNQTVQAAKKIILISKGSREPLTPRRIDKDIKSSTVNIRDASKAMTARI